MRRNGMTKATLAIAGLSGLLLGTTMDCSVPLCDERPGDPRCTGGTDGGTPDLALITTRLSKGGGRVNITAKVATGTSVKLVLPGSLEVACQVDAAGSGTCDVSMAQLASVTPGQIPVTLKAGDKTLSTKLRIFQPPTFMDATGMKATFSTGARQPTWVQVSQGHVFATNESATSMNFRIDEYMLSGTTLTATAARDTHFGFVPLGVMISISEGQTVKATPQAGMINLENADLTGTSYTSFKMLNLTKVNSVGASRDSTVVAVAGEGTDGPLKAYTLPSPGQTNSNSVTLTGSTTKAVTRVAVGKLTDTSGPDIVAAHADGASVFLQKAGSGNPALDQTLSTMVGSKLIGPGLTAMALGDIDRDGLDDIIAVQGASIIVLSIDGTTVTSTPVLSSLPMTVDAAAVGDVSGDGKPDLVIGQKAGAMLTVFINQAP